MKTKKVPFDIERAKAGAKVITRCGYPVTIIGCNSNKKYPIRAIIKTEDGPFTFSFTVEGKYCVEEEEHELDFFIEEEDVEAEEEEEVEETDYDPYKATVKSIADMVERYSELQTLEELKHFYNNVKVKCREAIEYDSTWNKNQDEEPADNKPKFKVGDWVISEQGMVLRITNVIENVANHTYGYSAESYDGVFGYSYFNKNVKCIRLWDIKDAKDGDVLVSDEIIFIFNRIKGEWIHCCCTLHRNGSFESKNYDLMHIKHCKEVHPATKEQRDFLFQKMKEVGYEWNADKKELHKIEKEVQKRLMTYQELAWWLRRNPEEFREWKFRDCDGVNTDLCYNESKAHQSAKYILIRKNGGEWMEPVIEIE